MAASIDGAGGSAFAPGMTRVRYRVVALATTLAMVTYLDRVCISKLAPDIMRDLHLSTVQMGYVFSAFAMAYALFEIPTAWWADRLGSRAVLTRIVVWWSTFTMATAAATSYGTMLVLRFLFGIGEAGAWPCAARALSRWIPSRERGTVQGVFFAGAHLVGGLTPILIVALLPHLTWRQMFVLFGTVGIVWVAAWRTWFTDDPTAHPTISPAERDWILAERPADVPHAVGASYLWRLLADRNVVALCIMYVSNSMMFYFCITWLPTYLAQRHGFDATALGFLSGLPLLVSVPSDLFGGVITDRLAARFGLKVGRCVLGASAYVTSAIALFVAAASGSPLTAAILIAVATGLCMFTLGAAWGICSEVGRNHIAVVGAIMNTAGQLASMACPLIVAYSVQWFRNWDLPLYLLSALFFVGAVCWMLIDPNRPVFAEPAIRGPRAVGRT
jgi:MFS transporter, ACS family, glucarate transporter